MKKTIYSVCVSFLFVVSLLGVAATLTFLISQPVYDQSVLESQIQIEEFLIKRREDNRNLTFYLEEQVDVSLSKAIVLAYSIYDKENRPFVFIVENRQNYIHATINQGGYASGVVIEKR